MCSGKELDKYSVINELARRRGFFWQSFEIYGGVGGFVTYGPLGTKLKLNIESKIRDIFVKKLGIFEIESSIITPGKVFEASGHVNHFKEAMVECISCGKRFRADRLINEELGISLLDIEKMNLSEIKEIFKKNELECSECKSNLKEPTQFLTMFKTTIGPYSGAIGYGRPEAAQNIFVEFNRLHKMAREKLPFGVLQIGHALRNEISPRQGLIRLREFTIADLEFFFDSEQAECNLISEVENEILPILLAEKRKKGKEETSKFTVREALEKKIVCSEWQIFFMVMAKRLLVEIGVPVENQRFIEKLPWEKAHYATQCFDQEVLVDRWGWIEVSGHAYRTDYDLSCHMKASGADFRVFKEFEKPIEKTQYFVKPKMGLIGPKFKEKAAEIIKAISKTPAEEIIASFEKKGYYMIGDKKISKNQVEITKQKNIVRGKRFIPHVVEPSFGCDRLFYVALEYALKIKDNRTILSFPRNIAPIQIGVFPLVNKDGLNEKAKSIYALIRTEGLLVEFDSAGSIGRRYARADEAGIPLCITIDYTTIIDDTVTIRDRDLWKQVRVQISALPRLLNDYFKGKKPFEDFGDFIKSK
jgi:glycyl-tRNA synthetase